VPVDLGGGSDRLIHMAAELARGFGTSLLVVHVIPEVQVRAHGGLHDAVKAHERARLREARERLRQLACANSGGIAVETHVAYGRAADEIGRVAIEQEVGAIVMGLTGEEASGSCPGSVAYRVLTMAPVPILALPLKKAALTEDETDWGRLAENGRGRGRSATFPER
jgi:nucleotide-binding universal stress UspA family protein